MKSPSQNISRSLRGQSVGGREGGSIPKSRMKPLEPVRDVPGEGGISRAPGMVDSRSAVHHAEAMPKWGK